MIDFAAVRGCLLIHGLNGAPSAVEDLRARLSAFGPVLAPSWIGHGGRSLPEPYSLDAVCDDLLAQVVSAGWQAVDIVGYSVGGLVGRRVAQRAASLASTLTMIASPAAINSRLESFLLHLLDLDRLDRADNPRVAVLDRYHRPNDWRAVATMNAGLVRALRSGPPAGLSSVHEIDVPTLIITGTRDPFGSLADCARLQREMPDAQLLVFAGTGHPLPAGLKDIVVDACHRHHHGVPQSFADDAWLRRRDFWLGSPRFHAFAIDAARSIYRRLRL